MNKKKLIKKLALPAAIVAALSVIILLLQIPFNRMEAAKQKEEFKKYISSFMEENKAYLNSIGSKIKSLPVDQVTINALQAEYLVDHQKVDQAKKYLWMISATGDLLFGVPSKDFDKLTEIYDKVQDIIKADNNYRNKNDFFIKLIDRYKRINFAQTDNIDKRRRYGRDDDNDWRFYEESKDYGLTQPTSTTFSSPVYDTNGKYIGELYLKVDDEVNEVKYLNENRIAHRGLYSTLAPIFIFLLVISGCFLWFLLPTWVYIDAQDRDVRNPGIWAFLALISLFFGLTVYLLTRPATLKSFTCPKCDGELNGSHSYCPHCGYDLANNFCQQCQYPIKPEWRFCPNCRTETRHEDKNSLI